MRALAVVILAAQVAAVPLITIARGVSSQILEPRQVVVQDDEAWRALWREHSARPLPPDTIDFSRVTVVGLFLGTRPTAGYSVEIMSVESSNADTILDYVERQPAPGVITAQVLTSPFHIVQIPKTTGRVVLRRAGP